MIQSVKEHHKKIDSECQKRVNDVIGNMMGETPTKEEFQEIIEILVEGLMFYAAKDNWLATMPNCICDMQKGLVSLIEVDKGHTARRILGLDQKEIKNGN